MDLQTKQIALASLKTIVNAPVVLPLVAANAQAGDDNGIRSFGVLFKSKLVAALGRETEVRGLVNDSRNFEGLELEQALEDARYVSRSISDLKLGGIKLPLYNVVPCSTGIKVNKVGANTNLKIQLDSKTTLQSYPARFISEFISYDMFSLYNHESIMQRVVIVKWCETEKKVVEVQLNDFFLKLTLIQDSRISLDTLLANPNMVLVLGFKGNKLVETKHPLKSKDIRELIESVYGISTYTAPSKANVGYIEFNVDLKGLAVEQNGKLHSFLGAKKMVARQEKLNGDTCIAMIPARVFVITEMSEKCNKYFNTGSFYASHNLLMSIGCSRVTSDINNLLIKGATHYAPWIIGQAGTETSIVASSSSKGDVAGIAAALGQAFNFAEEMEVLTDVEVSELTLANGEVVRGVYADITLKVTNSYTIENFMKARSTCVASTLDEAYAADVADKVEDLLGYNKETSRALSIEMMQKAATERMSIIDVLCCQEKEGLVQLKPAVTTVTPGEFENIALSFGRDVARNFMDYLLQNPFNRNITDAVKAAAAWLQGNFADAQEVSVYEMINIVSEVALLNDVVLDSKPASMGNTQFLRQVVQCLGLEAEGLSWVYIKELNVSLPCGKALYGNLFAEENDTVLRMQVPTCLKYLISTLSYLAEARNKGVINASLLESTGKNFKFFIQDSFLNKKTAKLKAHGKYMTLLPGFWLKEKHHVTLLSRDFYQPELSHLEYTKVNLAKHPVLFLQAVAGFHCFKEIPGVEVSNELRAIFMNTIFVHPDYLLELQNDTDGDLVRVTFDGYFLPLYTGEVMNSCAAAFHANYIAGENEMGINLDKAPKHVEFTHEELYQAIAQASEAKENVALFTDNLHKLQAGFRTSPVTKEIMVTYSRDVAAQLLKDIVIMTATLIQTDAMNAIKHSGGVTAGAALTSAGFTEEDSKEQALAAVIQYLDEHKFVTAVPAAEFANLVVEMFASIHMIDANRDKAFLTNQVERLTFKNQPNEIYLSKDKDGNEVVKVRRLDLCGIYSQSWNVTGANSMFSELVTKFFGRTM